MLTGGRPRQAGATVRRGRPPGPPAGTARRGRPPGPPAAGTARRDRPPGPPAVPVPGGPAALVCDEDRRHEAPEDADGGAR